jgi:hypothetical protein
MVKITGSGPRNRFLDLFLAKVFCILIALDPTMVSDPQLYLVPIGHGTDLLSTF